MYEDDLEEEELAEELEIALSQMITSKLFCGVPRKFTMKDFSHSFKKNFGRDADNQSIFAALRDSIDMDIVSELEDGTYEFNGIFWWTEDLN